MTERLDVANRSTAANLPTNAAVHVDSAELVLSTLDKLDEPPTLVALKAMIAARLPRVDLPELLEVHAHNGFAGGFTHASEDGSRAGDVATSICAVLLAKACNTGFESLIRRDNPALRRSRLSWVRQNYFRAETLTRSNATLVAAQNRIPLADRAVRTLCMTLTYAGCRLSEALEHFQPGRNRQRFGKCGATKCWSSCGRLRPR